MVDKEIKRKLKRIWCERLVIGLCVPVALGFSIVKVQAVFSQGNLIWHREQQAKANLKNLQQETRLYQARLEAEAEMTLQELNPQMPKMIPKSAKRIEEAQPVRYPTLAEMQKQAQTAVRYPTLAEVIEEALRPRYPKVLKSMEEDIRMQDTTSLAMTGSMMSLSLQLQQQQQQMYQQVREEMKKLLQESLFLGIAIFCFSMMLLLLLRQRNRISLTLTGQLICFFPEEYIAELEALHEQMKSEQRSNWLIRMIMLQNFLELLWAFYVQINIENLWLPQHRGRKNIDE